MATSYYAKLDRPEMGGGMLVEFGSAKFLKKAKTVSIVTRLGTVRFFDAKIYNPKTVKEASGAILGCTGTVSSNKLIITRTTLGGTMSGASFWYYVVGF